MACPPGETACMGSVEESAITASCPMRRARALALAESKAIQRVMVILADLTLEARKFLDASSNQQSGTGSGTLWAVRGRLNQHAQNWYRSANWKALGPPEPKKPPAVRNGVLNCAEVIVLLKPE